MTYLTYDDNTIDKRHDLPPPVRPYAKCTRQIPSFDTTSDVSLQTIPSASNVFVKTHNIGNRPPNPDTPPPSLNNPISTQPSTSHSPHQYITPSTSTTPSNQIFTQHSISQRQPTHPPILLFFYNVITTQPQAHSTRSYLHTF